DWRSDVCSSDLWHAPCKVCFAPWRSPVRTARPFGGSTLKRVLSISLLILPVLALVSAQSLSAQTVVVDKPTLTFSGQVGGTVVSQTVNVTSSTGAAIPFTLSYPSYPWLKVNNLLYGINGITPATLSVSADP